jgi:guanylate kinase
MTELRERLKNRDGETPVKIIEERFAAAVHEIALKDTYDLCLINQDAIETAANFGKIVSDIMANVPAKLIRSNYHQEAV